MEELHECVKCRLKKPAEAFGRTKAKKSGLQSWCRECHSAYEKEWRKKRSFDPAKPTKACLKCGVESSDFNKDRANADGLQDWCRPCHKAYREANRAKIKSQQKAVSDKWYRENKFWVFFKALKKRGADYVDSTLSFEQYLELRKQERCPICDVLMTDEGDKSGATSRTIDRLDSLKGYNLANCACICHRCNSVKNDGTAEDHERIAAWMRKSATTRSDPPVAPTMSHVGRSNAT